MRRFLDGQGNECNVKARQAWHGSAWKRGELMNRSRQARRGVVRYGKASHVAAGTVRLVVSSSSG